MGTPNCSIRQLAARLAIVAVTLVAVAGCATLSQTRAQSSRHRAAKSTAKNDGKSGRRHRAHGKRADQAKRGAANRHVTPLAHKRRQAKSAQATSTCTPDALNASFFTMFNYSFHYVNVYALENTGSAACSLTGYPMVAAYTSAPANAVPVTSSDMTDVAASAVTLQPGTDAGLVVAYVPGPNDQGPACDGPTTFEITLPGWSQPLVMPQRSAFELCAGSDDDTVYVSPVLSSPTSPTPFTSFDEPNGSS
jgi:hypothetical protein